MKVHSIQSRFMTGIIASVLIAALAVGGLSIYELDRFVGNAAKEQIAATCQKEAAQINGTFGNMETSVQIMESYVMGFVSDEQDIADATRRERIIANAERMFWEIADNTAGVVAYYLRFDPVLSDDVSGLFYSRVKGALGFVPFPPTDISLYERSDVEHVGWYWQPYDAGEPIWMKPYYNRNNDIRMISYVIPLYCGEHFVGVVGMDFDYEVLTEKVDGIRMYEHGFAHMEEDGLVAHHRELAAGEPVPDLSAEYMQVSEPLKNGMSLVLSASYDDIGEIRREIALKIVVLVLVLAALFSALAAAVVRRVVRPLKKLTEAAEKLSEGNYDVEIMHSRIDEIERLSAAFENMTGRLREHDQQQRMLAYRDSLTGLRNTTSYQAWMRDFDRVISRQDIRFGVIVLDVNYLKEANDNYGHGTGDRLLTAASQIIAENFKRSPVFRIGGDEFLVILQNRDLEECDALLELFEDRCAGASVVAEEGMIPVSIAWGLAHYDPKRDSCLTDVFERADEAMYEKKRLMKGGRGSDGGERAKWADAQR